MTNWIETYRGAVPPWQCDVTEHFTIAYYFDRLEEAEAGLAESLGVDGLLRRDDLRRRITARFMRELREGASFHVESAALDIADGLRVGHRVIDSADGEVVTWFDVQWDLPTASLTPQQRTAIAARLGTWEGPESEQRPGPSGRTGFVPTARGRVKHNDIDAAGHFAMGAMVHRFSNASAQLGASLGMNAAVLQQQRRGFSTFELILQISGVLRLDSPYVVETGIAHLGKSSLRMLHCMRDARSGAEVARLSQFGVNLDLDARRPAPWPEEMRARAEALVVPVG